MLDAGQYIITRGIPKTGQTISFIAGDDGDLEKGWWKNRLNSNNRTRFIQKTIGGDVIVIDRAEGKIWVQDWTSAGGNNGAQLTWANAIAWANGLTFAGWSDWHIPNAKELADLVDYSQVVSRINPAVFSNIIVIKGSVYWSSTTDADLTTQVFCLQMDAANTDVVLRSWPKAVTEYCIAVRDWR